MDTLGIQMIDQFNNSHNGLQIRLDRDERKKQIVFVTLTGSLSEMNSASYVEALLSSIEKHSETRAVIFDLSALSYISSSGIGAFVNILMRTEDAGITIVLCGLGKNVQSVFSVLGFTQFFKIVESREDAIRMLPSFSTPKIAKRHSCPHCHGKLEELDENTFRCLDCGTSFTRRKDGFFSISRDGGKE